MTLFTTRARIPVLIAGGLAVVLVAGCGNRVEHADIVAVGNGYGPVSVAPRQVQAGSAAVPEAGVPGAAAPGVAVASGPVGGAATGPGATPQAAVAKSVAGGGPNAAAGTPATARCTSVLSPIRLGQTLASSGLVGASIGGLRTGLAVWAKDVNARGGVQCHPVQVTSLDDGSDPSRVAANWNTLVHVDSAIALLAVGTPVGSAALRSSAERDQVPVIGADLNAEDYFNSPYIFPQGGLPLTAYDGAYLMAAKQKGPGGIAGLIYCVEITICTGVKNNHEQAAERAGLTLGPIQAASLTQPDYSAECQTMKQAGVTVLFLALDGSGSVRAARSCNSVGFKPAIATSAIAVSAQAAADPTLRQVGLFLGTNNVPFMSNTPAATEFRAAMLRYAPTALLEEQALFGWTSGKLFEAALAKVADRARSGDVTTAMVLDGLWQLKNEKIGGLGPGVTFTKGKPATAPDCFYGLKLGTDGFSAPIGPEPVCWGPTGKTSRPITMSPFVSPIAGRESRLD